MRIQRGGEDGSTRAALTRDPAEVNRSDSDTLPPGAALARMPVSILALQRTVGNAAVTALLRGRGKPTSAVQRCGPAPCDCPEEATRGEHGPASAVGAVPAVQQEASSAASTVQRDETPAGAPARQEQVPTLQRTADNAAVATALRARTAASAPRPIVQRDVSRERLLAALQSAVAQGDWRQVATRLNGLNPDDIKRTTGSLSLGQAANTRAAVLIFLDGWPQQQIILDGLDQGGGEVRRIGDLYAKYERAVAASDWPGAADALAPMTRDDMTARLGKLSEEQRDGIRAAAAGRAPLIAAIDQFSVLPKGTTYADVKNDLAYIDNFDSASYDVFRRELHLTYEDGHEAALPIAQTQQVPPTLNPKTQQTVADLQKSGQLTPPTSNAAGGTPGTPGFVTVIESDVFYNDPQTGVLRPQNLRPTVAPRLYQAITELDPATQDLLFQAGSAFISGGPTMPEGSEWLILLPIFARSGIGVREALVKAAERKALSKVEADEVRVLVTSGKGKRPYASSVGELEEAGVMARTAPTATLAPPKMKAVDWYEGGNQSVTMVQEKYKGKLITIQETRVSGGTWSQLHTVLEAKDATAANVSGAVTEKLNKYWNRLNNASLRKPARDPVPIAPNTYRRLYLDKPDRLVVNIHLREAPASGELIAAANRAADTYSAKADLPPVRVIVTGK